MSQPFAESELILNPDGSVYHLCLQPEDLADTIITVGDPGRVSKVSQYFDTIEVKKQHREYITHTGILNKKRLTVISTGVGTGNIDIVLNECDALANIDLRSRRTKSTLTSLNFIRIGTSGGLQEDVPVDSFVFSDRGVGLDSALNFYQYVRTPEEEAILQAFKKHLGVEAQKICPYISTSAPALRSLFQPGFVFGMTATCGGFYGAQDRTLRAPAAFPNLLEHLGTFQYQDHRIVNFEMETAAIYGLGRMLNHQCASLNLVINNRVKGKFTSDLAGGVDRLIRTALERITLR